MSGQNNFDVKLVADSLEVRSLSISGGRLELTLSARLDTAGLAQQIAAQLMAAATADPAGLTQEAEPAESAVPLFTPRAAGAVMSQQSALATPETTETPLEDAEIAGAEEPVAEISADDAGAVLLGHDALEEALALAEEDGAQSMTAEGAAPEAGDAGDTDTATGVAGGAAAVAEVSTAAAGRYGEPQPDIEWSAVLGELPAVPQEIAGDEEADVAAADTPSEQGGEVADLPPDIAPFGGELPQNIDGTQDVLGVPEESGAFGAPEAERGDIADNEYPVQVEELATRRLAPEDLPELSHEEIAAQASGHEQHPAHLADETVELPERLFPPEEDDENTRSMREELLRTETDTLPEPDPDEDMGAPAYDPDFPDNDEDYDSFIFGERSAGVSGGSSSGVIEPEAAQTPPTSAPPAEDTGSAYFAPPPVEPAAECPPPLPLQAQEMPGRDAFPESRRVMDMPTTLPPQPERKGPPRIKYVCPKCRTPGQQDAERLGSVVTCANCGRAMRLTMKK